MYVYDRCIQKHKSKHKWIAFIDIDEFFVLHNPKHRQLQDLLPAYEQYGGESYWPGCSPVTRACCFVTALLRGVAASMLSAAELGVRKPEESLSSAWALSCLPAVSKLSLCARRAGSQLGHDG